jgi:hypothetical protein
MSPQASSSRIRALGILLLCWLLAAAGCGGARSSVGKVVPVSGKITVGAQPLTVGKVSFIPDASRGNTSISRPFGMIGSDGTYQLVTEANQGAPPGWYKITISTLVPPGSDVPPPGKQVAPRPAPINPKYTNPKWTDLAVEVKDDSAAGAYDLRLTK